MFKFFPRLSKKIILLIIFFFKATAFADPLPAIVVDPTGKVGIGTATPDAQLTVKVPNEIVTDPNRDYSSKSLNLYLPYTLNFGRYSGGLASGTGEGSLSIFDDLNNNANYWAFVAANTLNGGRSSAQLNFIPGDGLSLQTSGDTSEVYVDGKTSSSIVLTTTGPGSATFSLTRTTKGPVVSIIFCPGGQGPGGATGYGQVLTSKGWQAAQSPCGSAAKSALVASVPLNRVDKRRTIFNNTLMSTQETGLYIEQQKKLDQLTGQLATLKTRLKKDEDIIASLVNKSKKK